MMLLFRVYLTITSLIFDMVAVDDVLYSLWANRHIPTTTAVDAVNVIETLRSRPIDENVI